MTEFKPIHCIAHGAIKVSKNGVEILNKKHEFFEIKPYGDNAVQVTFFTISENDIDFDCNYTEFQKQPNKFWTLMPLYEGENYIVFNPEVNFIKDWEINCTLEEEINEDLDYVEDQKKKAEEKSKKDKEELNKTILKQRKNYEG